ncbi:hypothetical protein WR25_20061 [Diploscapter pachys]|uniref:Actin-related protein 2/3 complex subunit 5 n=1 Tax=Diploscapter pachys TaxID=2018661 RepID=A0A2A2LMG1_9BILA|nr:hypothetical protein WR25_18586 [Diploscapter pachys]PAV89820.1 hypothetical protein WR25_20061 [Diploscapter pachys]
MAKNMQNTGYRKLDVDAYDPENYNENDEGVDTPGLGPDERTVSSLMSTNRLEDALRAALQNPPLNTKNQAVKDKATQLVAKVLGSYKASDIEATVKKLTDEEGDTLMKYVYKAMEISPENALCQLLLNWHAQLVARFGLGSIIRVMSDRRRL